VGDGNVGYGDASRQGQEDVPAGFDPSAGIRGRGASAFGKAREAAEGEFLGGGDACHVHNTAQNPFQMSWRNVVCAARDGHRIARSASAERRVIIILLDHYYYIIRPYNIIIYIF
jgi:hypothetical protein